MSCILGNINFYQRLLAVTLGPLIALAFLGVTYAVAMHIRPCGLGQTSSEARQRVVVRHASAALLVLFLVRVYSSICLREWRLFVFSDDAEGGSPRSGFVFNG